MNKYSFYVMLCDGWKCDGKVSVLADNEDIAQDMALDYVCSKLANALPELGIEVSVELDDDVICEENEERLVQLIEEAKQYCKGELELDLFGDDTHEYGWYAMDYREDLEQAFPIDNRKYDKPLITEDFADEYGIDVKQICDLCHIYYCW